PDWWFKSSVKGSVERSYNGIAYIRLLSKRSASKYADGSCASAHLRFAQQPRCSMEVLSVEQEYRDELVYNFEVEDNHTYFVTENAVLVHNYDPSDYKRATDVQKLTLETNKLLTDSLESLLEEEIINYEKKRAQIQRLFVEWNNASNTDGSKWWNPFSWGDMSSKKKKEHEITLARKELFDKQVDLLNAYNEYEDSLPESSYEENIETSTGNNTPRSYRLNKYATNPLTGEQGGFIVRGGGYPFAGNNGKHDGLDISAILTEAGDNTLSRAGSKGVYAITDGEVTETTKGERMPGQQTCGSTQCGIYGDGGNVFSFGRADYTNSDSEIMNDLKAKSKRGDLHVYGNSVSISEPGMIWPERYTITTEHLDKAYVVPESKTTKNGDKLGNMSYTGNSKGAHLHFNVHVDHLPNYTYRQRDDTTGKLIQDPQWVTEVNSQYRDSNTKIISRIKGKNGYFIDPLYYLNKISGRKNFEDKYLQNP
ncbi:MAG: hypothetical protein KDK45_01065, partial [Leptospiraceae bacterium]|nr:hypothetical protein [Leptospiraceae bacterium]